MPPNETPVRITLSRRFSRHVRLGFWLSQSTSSLRLLSPSDRLRWRTAAGSSHYSVGCHVRSGSSRTSQVFSSNAIHAFQMPLEMTLITLALAPKADRDNGSLRLHSLPLATRRLLKSWYITESLQDFLSSSPTSPTSSSTSTSTLISFVNPIHIQRCSRPVQ